MKTLNYWLLMGCILWLTACGGKQYSEGQSKKEITIHSEEKTVSSTKKTASKDDGTAEHEMKILQVQNVKTPKPLVKKNQKIIKTADVRFQVKNLAKSIAKMQAMIRKHEGYVSSAKQDRQYNRLQSKIVVRVESDKFEDLLDEMVREAVFLDYKNVKAEDVTEEFVDIQSRLKTKRAVEKRYLEILEKAKSIEEILKVENQLRVIREEIEAKEGRLKFLVDQINYSTISMEVYQRTEAAEVPSDGFFTKMGRGFVAGWKGILGFIIGLTYAWPTLLVLGVGGFFGVRYLRRRLTKKG
ncbi:DUF4349 domain-containing protein [uncultured Microscilla sp.]|uniref:DUF4349 domain-containing protein n=1 Tax=uncultured Microscilla sp. TaxID=432653 RepID=UPI0026161103|nr:DUF4349 domain-containing protein [uncultured Microscilla sp.]